MKKESNETQNIINYEQGKRKREKMKNTKKSNIINLEERKEPNHMSILNKEPKSKSKLEKLNENIHSKLDEKQDIEINTEEQLKADYEKLRKGLNNLEFHDLRLKTNLVKEYLNVYPYNVNHRKKLIERALVNLSALIKNDYDQWKETLNFEKIFIDNLEEELFDREMARYWGSDSNDCDVVYGLEPYEFERNQERTTKFLQNLIDDLRKREREYYSKKSAKVIIEHYDEEIIMSNCKEYEKSQKTYSDITATELLDKFDTGNYIELLWNRKQIGLDII